MHFVFMHCAKFFRVQIFKNFQNENFWRFQTGVFGYHEAMIKSSTTDILFIAGAFAPGADVSCSNEFISAVTASFLALNSCESM